ncbi:unnamed protein product [Alopecurus aequalis]
MAAVSSLLLLILLLVAPPFSLARGRSSSSSGRYGAKSVRSTVRKTAKDYLRDNGKDDVRDFAGDDGHQLGISAAASYSALTFDLSVGSGTTTYGYAQSVSVVMDITSELVWAQCDDPCTSCKPWARPSFRSSISDSFVPILCGAQSCQRFFPGDCTSGGDLCGYIETFYPSGNTSGYIAHETFNFETTAIPGMVFGCANKVLLPDLAGASGFAGFSRSPLSLVSQLQMSQFSYLIAIPDYYGNSESFLRWTWDEGDGPLTAPDKGSPSTPLLVPTSKQNPYWYYVKLTGIEVDGQLLTAIPTGTFDVKADGSGGVSLSTTLPVTYLEEAAHKVLREKLLTMISAQGVALTQAASDLKYLCFVTEDFERATVPKLALVFDGSNAVMELSVENYFFKYDDGQTCLTIVPSTGRSVLGSLLQVDTTMTYDLYAHGGGLLTFETAAAARSSAGAHVKPQAQVPLVIIITTLLAAWGVH